MNKVVLCLILTCFQAFSLTHNFRHEKVHTQLTDTDHTDWTKVAVTVTSFLLNQDLRNMFDSSIITNTTHSEIIYQHGLSRPELPNIYERILSHRLINVTIDYWYVTYFYSAIVQDTYTNDIYQRDLGFLFFTSEATDPENIFIATWYATPDPVHPIISVDQLNFTNTTEITYDILPILYNKDLIDQTISSGKGYIQDQVNEAVGQGNYASIDIPSLTVNIENSDLIFVLSGDVWQDEEKSTFKVYIAQVKLNPEDQSISNVSFYIDPEWTTIPL